MGVTSATMAINSAVRAVSGYTVLQNRMPLLIQGRASNAAMPMKGKAKTRVAIPERPPTSLPR